MISPPAHPTPPIVGKSSSVPLIGPVWFCRSASTNLLYSGEWYDSDAAQYYLRARWYSPANGRFNRMDPFAGNSQDPQSLHKYLYVHCNPINGIDPTGMFSIGEVSISIAISASLSVGFDILAGERDPKVIMINSLVSAIIGLIGGPLLGKGSRTLARGLVKAGMRSGVANFMQVLTLGDGRSLLGTVSYMVKFKLKHGRAPDIEAIKVVFLANLALGIPLAWIETGAIGRLSNSFAEDCQGILKKLQENGTLELANSANPDSIFRMQLGIFLNSNLPSSVGTVLFNLQSETASVLASFFGDSQNED